MWVQLDWNEECEEGHDEETGEHWHDCRSHHYWDADFFYGGEQYEEEEGTPSTE